MKRIWKCACLALALVIGSGPLGFGPAPSMAEQSALVTDTGWPREFHGGKVQAARGLQGRPHVPDHER
jgi:hypothetical protein